MGRCGDLGIAVGKLIQFCQPPITTMRDHMLKPVLYITWTLFLLHHKSSLLVLRSKANVIFTHASFQTMLENLQPGRNRLGTQGAL